MPTLTEKLPPPHGADSALVTGTLMVCGVTARRRVTVER